MTLPELENLVRIGQLRKEAPLLDEFEGLVRSGKSRATDAARKDLAFESRFDLAYNAAHALALASIRWHGYRPDQKRFVVFQAVAHTLKLPPVTVRILAKAHTSRNTAEYEGYTDADEQLLKELLAALAELSNALDRLGPPPKPD